MEHTIDTLPTASTSSCSASLPTIITTLHFTPTHDCALIRETIAEKINPAKGKTTAVQWLKVVTNLNAYLKPIHKKVSLRQVKERAAALLKAHRANVNASKKASGVDEVHDELTDLLEEWCQIIAEMEAEVNGKCGEKSDLEKQGSVVRDAAMRRMGTKRPISTTTGTEPEDQADDTEEPTRSNTKRRKSDLLEYLMEKNELDRELRREELRLEERRIQIQEEEMKTRKIEAENMRMMLEVILKKN